MHESAVSGTLLMSGLKSFAVDAAFENRAPRDIFTHPTKKLPCHSQIFARKPEPNNPRVLSTQRAISVLRPYVSPLLLNCRSLLSECGDDDHCYHRK